MWERLSRSLLAIFRLWLELWKKKNQVCSIFPDFFHFYHEKSGGKLLVLNLVWERLSRLILTAFRFWLEFRKSIFFNICSTLFGLFHLKTSEEYFILEISGDWKKKRSLEICVGGYLGLSVGAVIYLTALRFWPECWRTIFQLFFDFFSDFFFLFFILKIVWVDFWYWI